MGETARKSVSPPTAMSSKGAAAGKKNKSLSRCLKAPFRFLRRARDIYVRSLCGCAGAGGGSRGGGFTAGVVALMPRARSRSAFGPSNRFGSGEDDFRDLVRVSTKGKEARAAVVVPRSQSTPAIERIDEEQVYEFEGDVVDCQRSQSCTVVSGGRMIGVRALERSN